LQYTLPMAFIRSQQVRCFFAVCITLAILFTQGLRVQLHSHTDLTNFSTVHTHIVDGVAAIDNDVTASIEIGKDALIKVLDVNPLLALVTLELLLFVFGLQVWRAIPLPRSQFHLFDPPFHTPPSHAPPR
jgi:hypothetical protein